MDMTQIIDPFKEEIIEPSDSIVDQLIRTEIDFESEIPLSETVQNSIAVVLQKVGESESKAIDIIGAQMEILSTEFNDCIAATQRLFAALTKLKDSEVSVIEEKTNSTCMLIKNIETTMGCIRKISDK